MSGDTTAGRLPHKPGLDPTPWDAAHPEKGLAVDRVSAAEHRFELVGLDLAFKTELCGGVADPFAGVLALARVVVLVCFRDFVEVVARLSALASPRERPRSGSRGG
jgi:hypothetical protein